MEPSKYDLIVIGSGPAGQKGAIAAAKLGKRVALVDRSRMLGGVSLHTGTIPSKTLREAVLYLSGYRQRAFYGQDYVLKQKIAVADLSSRVRTVVERELEVLRNQLNRNDVETIDGMARFSGPTSIEVETAEGTRAVTADRFLIACGTRPARNDRIPIDARRLFDSDQLHEAAALPREVIVVGAGVIGLEYASMLAALGAKVTIIDARPTILDFVDQEIVEALCYHLRRSGATLRFGEKVVSAHLDESEKVITKLESGKTVHGDALLYAVGRQPNTDLLRIEQAGLTIDPRGRIRVNEHYQTEVPHIYAAGDVIGAPALASTSMDQGRLAVRHMYGLSWHKNGSCLPFGIYTIPEISMVGRTEQELTAAKAPYEVGLARYEELAKGQMLGDRSGLLKILFDPDSLKVLGVHILGEGASELIHTGQAVMCLGGTMEYFRETVFNYPTLAEAYKVAAHDGLNKVGK